MNQQDAANLIEVVREPIADISMAIVLLIQTLKQQPNFDVSLFNSQLEKILTVIGDRPICAELLKQCIDVEEA